MNKLLEQTLSELVKLPESQRRKALLALPPEARHAILAAQAEEMLEYYEQDETWRENDVGDLFEA